MIYEMRTYHAKPGGGVAAYEKSFSEAYPTRAKYGDNLWGYFHTDIGALNQLVHIWAYESLQERADIRAAALKDTSGNWPPHAVADLLVSQENDILLPIKGMTERKGPLEWGSLYELRMYTYAAGDAPKAADTFSEALPGREAAYPVAGMWTSDVGNLNRVYMLFPFKNWAHRDQLRVEMQQKGVWPPRGDTRPLTQNVRHLLPASFSPLR